MNYIIKPMSREKAQEICKWIYEGPYSLYSMDESEETMMELLDNSFYSVENEEEGLVGYYCFGKQAQVPTGNQYGVYDDLGYIDIGLGMRPDLTGKGKGYSFVKEGVDFAVDTFSTNKIRLTVASFNERAIKTYERVGFERDNVFIRKNKDNNIEFIVMKYNK